MNSFDERAATWDDDPAKVERAAVIAAAIRDAVPLGPSVRLLEYGAGTGLVTQALRSSVGPITLVDTSAGMRDVMLAKIASGAIPEARVWDLDLETAAVPAERFDLVVTVLTLHHVHDVPIVLARFAELLDAGGHLCIADLDAEDGSFHGPDADVHHGFDRGRLTDALTAAGFTDVQIRDCHSMVRDGVAYPIFLATCRTGLSPGRSSAQRAGRRGRVPPRGAGAGAAPSSPARTGGLLAADVGGEVLAGERGAVARPGRRACPRRRSGRRRGRRRGRGR